MRLGYWFAVIVSSVWPLAAQTYSLKTEQPVAVGQLYDVSATGSSRKLLSSGDRTLQLNEFQVSYEGQARVAAVDKSGQPYKLWFTTRKFVRTHNGTSVDVLPPGSIVVADGSRKEHYSLGDRALSGDVKEAFSLVYSAHRPNSIGDDEMFGTKQARSVGESWRIDSELAQRAFQEGMQDMDVSLDSGQVSGTVRFTGIDKLAERDCAHLEAQVTVGNFSMKSLAPGVVVDRGSLQAELSGYFPLKETGRYLREGTSMHTRVAATGPDGQKVEFAMDQKMENTWLPSGEKP